jgi:DnaA family protein
MSQQLALGIELDVAASFDSFFAEGSSEALTAVRQLSEGFNSGALWIYGPPGVGKSHLLQAACRRRTERGGNAMYLPLSQAGVFGPAILEGVETLDLLAIDDVDAVAGDPAWEAALFAAVNAFLINGAPLLIAATVLPRDVGFALPDLSSRAGAHVVYRIPPLSDAGLEQLFISRARARGLQCDTSVVQYLLRRVPRDMRVLEQWLVRLDRASLAAQKRVTIALIRSLLESDDFVSE